MKLKQFIFALVAMLSFSFSSFAQTVTTAEQLKAALNSTGAVVTLGDNITMTETISIPTGVSVTLDLNGKNITTSAACDVFEVVGTMVINDSKGTGSVTGKTNRVLYVKAKGKLTINGGRFFKNSGRVVYSAGKLIINGGSVETTPEAALNVNTAAITSATGTLELNGGTVTSIAAQTCDLKIAGATVEAGVNILKTNKSTEITAGTINGNVTIAPEAADNVTVSGGSFEDADAIKNYLASGSAILDKGDGTFEVVAGQFKVGGNYYPTFAAALNAVENGQTIELLEDATGDEKSTELTFDKDIKFTITGKAPQYALPVVTFQNAEVTIKDAEILIPELDARQNAVINIVNSTVHDAGGNSIAKSYYNGTINIDENSTVYMMQITTMGYINVAGTVNATWQTNVYGNGMISLTEGAKFNTGALHLTGQDYSGRDNTDADRVGKPATIVVDGATLNVGSVKSDNGSDYSYNSSKGINVGTVDGKLALLDVMNGGAVNFYMANGQTTNFGAGATVNVAASTLKTICRDENGTVSLANAGNVNVTGASNLNIKNYSGNAINATNTTLADVQFGGAVNAFGTNNISGTSVIGGVLSLGYGTNPTEQVVVNITGNFNGTNVLVYTNNGVDNILNVGKADGERTTVHFGQLGAFADVNVVNTDVTYGYAFIRNDFNATNSTFAIKGGVNTYFSGNAKVALDNTTWNLEGYANIGSYGGYMYGNADVTLKNGSSMTATSLGVEVSGENVVKLTLEDNSSLTATKLTNQGSIVLASTEATLTSNECANVTTNVADYNVAYANGAYTLVAKVYVAKVGDAKFETLNEAVAAVEDGGTITLIANETFTETNRTHNSGTWYDGLYYVGDKSFTIDLGGFTISHDGAVNDYLLNFKNSGSKANTITLKNGTIDAGTAAFCAICTSSSQANELTINTEDINIINNISNGSTIKLRGGAVLNVKGGTKITGKNSYLGIECVASTVNIYDGAEIYMNGTTSYNGCLVGACGGGTVNVYGGYGKGAKGGFIAMTSGGTINVKGGEWIANTDGTVGNNSNVYVLTAQSNKNEQGFVGPAIINVTGGTFRGGMDAWVLNNHKDEKAELNISGGNFNANPTKYVEENFVAVENDGVWTVVEAVAKIDKQGYASLQAAINKVQNGETITLIADVAENVTLTEKTGLYYTIDGNGKTMTGTITVSSLSDTEDNRRITIKNINFVDTESGRDFITSTATNHYPRITVEGCSFTGTGKEAANSVAIRLKSSHSVVIKDCTGTGLHSFLQNTSGWNLTIENVKVTDSKSGLALGTVQGVTVKGCDLAVEGYGVRLDAGYNNNAVIEDNKVEAFIPVVVRKATVDSNITVKGENEFTASNTDGLWCAIGTSEYEANGEKPTAATGNVKVAVSSNLPQSGLYGNHVEGSLTAAYAGADGYWGECGGNANYSFELKFFNGETYMGSTSLNDKDNIIDGDVYVTWNMLLNAESNTDEYWTMAWTVAPSVAKQPNRVEQWVDGVKVAECAIQLNGPDNLNPIATAVVDDEGNLVKCYPTLEAAVAAGNNVAILKAGTYKVPQGKNLTITGAVEGVKFANIGAHNMGGASMTFNNVTFEYGNENYKGLQHSGNLVYNNCTFNGQVFLYGQSETFNKCTFNQTSADAYNVWTYGAKEVAFNECTFNCAGKSVLIYSDQPSATNNVTVTKSQFIASQAVEGKAAIEMDSSISGAVSLTIDGETTATDFAAGNVSGNSLWNNKKGNSTDANNDITVKVGDVTVLAPVYEAQIGEKNYRNLQDAVNAVKDGETVVLVKDFTGNITLTEKVGLHYTLDGAGKTMNGKIVITPLSDENDNRRITIKNIKFVNTADAAVDFISCAVTNHYPRLTVKGCTFTGNGKDVDVALRLKTAYGAVIEDCTGTGLHSFLQNTAGKNLTIKGVTVTDSKSAFALGTVQGVTVQGVKVDVKGYGIRLDANTYNNNAVIEDNAIKAFIPVVVRNVNTTSNVIFAGKNEFAAGNTDGKWCVIGATEYEENGKLPAEVAAGNVVVTLKDEKLTYDGIHGAGLAGKGTAEKPYLINNVAELEIFRNSVNAGSAKYSKPGLCIALNADIDMTGVNWVGIGSATKDHGFMGNFDGKNFKIMNLTITNPALDSDGYAYAGLFGVTEGTDKDNQNVIKNLTIENVTINTTGDIVSAAIAYPYYTIVDNVKVCGDIKIQGGDYTAGVLAYTRRCVNASNLAIVGNDGSYVKGAQTVGGVISDIQMNGGLTAVYSNFSAEGITVTGEKSVGGIAGIIATQTLNGAAVKNVTLNSTDEFAGVVAGRLGGTSTISNVVSENVTGATAVIGATYDGAKAVEARIGDTYYSTFAAAYTAAKAGETVTMLTDLNMSEILVLDKAITLDGNSKTLTSTAARAINVDCEGNVGIKNLTINASGERAINVINKPANVTIEGVTATAANYTVNLAGSAAGAVVDVKNSNLTGLNVVNVAAAGAQVTVDNTTLNCADDSEAEGYAALVLNKDAKNGSIVATNVTFNIVGDSRKASNQAEGGTITIDGSADEVEQHVAYISYGSNWYGFATLEAAIAKANAGETVTLLRDITASAIITIDKAITLDGNGKTLTSTAGRAINVDCDGDVAIKNLTINAKGERAINVIQKPANVTIENVTATAANYTVNVASSAGAAKVAINNSTLNGLCTVNVSAAGANVTVDNSTVNCNDNNTTTGEAYAALCLNKEAVGGSIVATNTTVNVAAGSDSMKGRNSAENGTVTINGSTDGVAVMVAVITYEGSDYYHSFSSLAEAVEFAKAGDVVTLISDVTVAQPVVINKSVTLNGNGKTLTYTGADRAIEMPNVADANYDVTIKNLNVVATTANRGLNYNDNGKLNVEGVTVTIGENVDGYAINFPGMADGAQVTIKDSKLTSRNPLNIWGENMTINVHNSEIISVDNSTTYDYAAIQLNNDNYGNVANGTVVNVFGGTITALNDNGEPSNAVANSTETGVVNISDETVITGKVLDYVANIGGVYFGSLQAAVNAIEKYGYNSPIVLMKSFSTSEATTIKSGLNVTINLNGKTITGTDNATGSFGLITNKGNLTINGEGAITLVATKNREWNAYSSVISNTVGGKLTVNGGTIEHLGGTDMAYAIDNLTNGKGTKAETIINGGTVKSTYRAVRQFLNGTEAENILTVNGGTIEGANKSIWMQDPSKNSNTGTLTVAADAKLTGDVYLSVTAGSTEWPVEVAVAAAALQGESKVLTSNVPAGYDVAEVNGTYGVYTGVAKIGTAYYETLKAAVAAAQAGETITLIDNVEATEVILLGKSLTINGNGHKVTSNATRVFRATTSNTEITLNDVNMVNTAVRVGTNDIRGISVDDVQNVKLTLNNCSVDFTDASANDWTYAVNVVGGSGHVVTVNGGAYEGANVINVRGANQTVTVKDATLTSLYPNNALYFGACIYVVQNENSSVVATGNTFNGDNAFAFNVGYTPVEESDNIDNTKYVVAMIGDAYYTSIQDAVEAAQNGETIKLTQNVKMDTKGAMANCDGYPTFVCVEGKAITIDLNGKDITANAYAEDLTGTMLLGVFSTDNGGKLTLVDSEGSATVTLKAADDAKVYSLLCNFEDGCQIKVEGGTYVANKVIDSMLYTGAGAGENEGITVNGGNFTLGNVGEGANGKPWIFNVYQANAGHVVVNGGTFNADVNHQFWANEVFVPETKALKDNGNGTWTVVDAAAYTMELATSTGATERKVGYATLHDAIAAVKETKTITLVKDITYTKDNASVNGNYVDGFVYTGDKSFTIDFNGKTITDDGCVNDYLIYINNKGEKASEITFTNGTIVSKNGCWSAVCVNGSASTQNVVLNLNGMNITNSNDAEYSGNPVVRVRNLATVNVNDKTVITSNGASYGVAANTDGSTLNINEGATIVQKNSGTTGGNSVFAAVGGKGVINIKGGTITSDKFGVHTMTTGTPVINISGGTITAPVALKSSTNGGNGELATINVTGGRINGTLETYTENGKIVVSGGTFDAMVDTKYVATGYICKDNNDGTFGVIVDPKHGKVAQIIRSDYYAENQYFATINEAVQAAVSGETVTLIADVETSAAGYATVGEEEYAVLVAVKEKDITLNLNGKSVTVNPTAEELTDAEGKMLMSVFGMDTNGKLTLTGNGSVKVNANGANVYSLVAAYGEGSAVVIENGNYEADAVTASGSLIYSHEMITVMGGTFNLGNLGTGANGSPWIFNTIGQNYTGVKVVGGTFPTDINHQFWANEVLVPEAYALENNGDGTWTVVDAVAYTDEKATSRGASWRHVGYASLEDAIAATGKYNCQNNTVTLIKDITLAPITVANGVKVAIDLNGKTISATDNSTATYCLITNKGELTINGTGIIQLTAENDRGWGARSAVISNEVGGKLTVNSGTIQHLGGTAMAYAIDNLTNGKDTYAETIINGGVVKSKYIAIRQFLNGVEAKNILTVNGGTLEGETASLYFQDPSKNANTGTLNVLDGTLAGDVYLDVTEGSTEWPVEVYIDKDALGQNVIHADNVPADAAALVEYDTFWQVEQKNLAELTIYDACDEYINKIEKNVAELTYERYFDDTEWQTIVLPFDVPVANLMEQFEVAYIYNASYKNGVATIDYVEIKDAEFVLAANYPYMIKAKATGWNNIVVKNAKLMPTEAEILDCSSIFEKFSFIGNYATVDADDLDETMGYFNLTSGAWSKMDVVNPFRFYMQIKLRNGNAFEYPTDPQAIRMRSVNANGEETTGINGVDAEQAGDFIFDLHGRRVLETEKGGIYIKGGKKFIAQ